MVKNKNKQIIKKLVAVKNKPKNPEFFVEEKIEGIREEMGMLQVLIYEFSEPNAVKTEEVHETVKFSEVKKSVKFTREREVNYVHSENAYVATSVAVHDLVKQYKPCFD